MRDDKPSITAWRVARQRALHPLIDRPRVFDDPLALRLLGTFALWMVSRRVGRAGHICRAMVPPRPAP